MAPLLHRAAIITPTKAVRESDFQATVCKTVRPMLSDHCLSLLSVMLVYCGQAAGCVKMPVGTQVGLSPGNIVLDGDLSPQKGTAPLPPPKKKCFWPMSVVAKRLDRSRCRLVRRQATLYTTNPIIFIVILQTFQTVSNRHFALLSSSDFHAVIVLHGSHALHHCTY